MLSATREPQILLHSLAPRSTIQPALATKKDAESERHSPIMGLVDIRAAPQLLAGGSGSDRALIERIVTCCHPDVQDRVSMWLLLSSRIRALCCRSLRTRARSGRRALIVIPQYPRRFLG